MFSSSIRNIAFAACGILVAEAVWAGSDVLATWKLTERLSLPGNQDSDMHKNTY